MPMFIKTRNLHRPAAFDGRSSGYFGPFIDPEEVLAEHGWERERKKKGRLKSWILRGVMKRLLRYRATLHYFPEHPRRGTENMMNFPGGL